MAAKLALPAELCGMSSGNTEPPECRLLVAELENWPADVVHAQHVLSAPPAISAATRFGLPAVVTVRDYCPVCYFTTAHVEGASCPDCGFAEMLACMREKSPHAY